MITGKSQFERRHLFYCDLLGFSCYTLSEFFESGRCLQLFHQLDRMVADASIEIDPTRPDEHSGRVPDYIIKPEVVYFSDAIAISTPATPIDAIWICEAAAMIQNQICRHGFLVRGSIVTDDLYHASNTIFGPAIVKAAALEKQVTLPVVVVSDQTIKYFRDAISEEDKEIVRIREYQLIAHDESPLPYVDPFWLTKIHTNQPSIHPATHDKIESWRKLIERGLRHDDAHVREKYEWMARHFNRCLCGKLSEVASIHRNRRRSIAWLKVSSRWLGRVARRGSRLFGLSHKLAS